MNENLQYAEMLNIPVNSCNITYKPTRKRTKKVKEEKVKEQIIEKINDEIEKGQEENAVVLNEQCSTSTISSGIKRKKIKLNVVTVELCVVFLLIATIFLTSVLIPKSGINSFFSSVFGGSAVDEVDSRTFADFSPVFANVKIEDVVTENGIMSIKNQNSIYTPCNGCVSKIVQNENGLFTVEIEHNENFKSVIDGLKYVYTEVGNDAYTTVPIGYAMDTIAVCFIDANNNVITENVVSTCAITWGE